MLLKMLFPLLSGGDNRGRLHGGEWSAHQKWNPARGGDLLHGAKTSQLHPQFQDSPQDQQTVGTQDWHTHWYAINQIKFTYYVR